jgi:hypothetical protein
MHTNGSRIRFYSAIGCTIGANIATHHSGWDKDYINSQLVYTRDTAFSTRPDSLFGIYCALVIKAGVEIDISKNIMIKTGLSFNLASTNILGSPYDYNYTGGSGSAVWGQGFARAFIPYSVGLNVAILFGMKTQNGKMRID